MVRAKVQIACGMCRSKVHLLAAHDEINTSSEAASTFERPSVHVGSVIIIIIGNGEVKRFNHILEKSSAESVKSPPTTSWKRLPRASSRHACKSSKNWFKTSREYPLWGAYAATNLTVPCERTTSANINRKDICFTNFNLDTCRSWSKIPTPAAGDKGVLPMNKCPESRRTVPNALRVSQSKTTSQHKPASSPSISGNLFCKRAFFANTVNGDVKRVLSKHCTSLESEPNSAIEFTCTVGWTTSKLGGLHPPLVSDLGETWLERSCP